MSDNPFFEVQVYQDPIIGATGNRKHRASLSIDGGSDNCATIYAFGETPQAAYFSLLPEADKLVDAINTALHNGKLEVVVPGTLVFDFRKAQAAYKESPTNALRGEMQTLWFAMSDAEQREIAGVPE